MTAVRESAEVVGWGQAGAAWASERDWSVSRRLAHQLHAVGVRQAFGLLGGGIAPFASGLASSPIAFFHFRHEAGAGFAAIEAHFESGAPTALVVTTGPGLLNALNPVMAARVDGAKLLVISGFTGRGQVGRGAVQETSIATMPAEVTRPGRLFHEVVVPETLVELDQAVAALQRGFASPGGFVAHLGLPLPLQTQMASAPPPQALWRIAPPAPSPEALERCLQALSDPDAILWVGHGARRAAAPLRRLAELAGLRVVGSPRAKGVFPEDHPLFVGVSGAGGSAAVREAFARRRPRAVLVVGTRLGEVTSFLAPGLTPSERWLHVDLDPTAFGAAFPGVAGEGIVADAGAFFEGLLALMQRRGWAPRPPPQAPPALPPLEPAPGDVRPSYLMQALQRRVVDRTEAVLHSEAGTSFTWCNSLLKFSAPGRYRTSAAWGSMGHFTTGCVGTALAGRRAVAVVGDGAMLMNNEINTAVQYGARVVWVVLNDAQLGLNEHGMTALGMRPVETQMPRTDFVAFARSQGADGLAVVSEDALEDALEVALAAPGPFVLDVRIDRTVPSPVVAERIRSLQRQAGEGA
jgi:acetolactate synthase-1/2/3 large subunit